MPGYDTQPSLTGRVYGNIEINDVIGNSPKRYELRCKRCGCRFVKSHTDLRARIDSTAGIDCPDDNCRLGITSQRQREKDYFRDLKAKERADAEAAEDARLRKKYGLKPPPPPAPKPSLDELTLQVQDNASELARIERQNILAGLRDESFRPDPKYENFSLPTAEVDSWNDEQANIFMDNCPDYYPSPENSRVLLDYILAQGVRLISAETFKRAYDRLMQFNLLETRPPEPEPEQSPEPEPMQHEQYPDPPRKTPLGTH